MYTLKKINREDIEDIIALTPTQEGMLYHYLKDPQGDYYFEQISLTITGEIDINCFRQAWQFVVETNEMLRTRFRWDMIKKPVQIILKKHRVRIIFHDFSNTGINENDKLKLIEEVKEKDRKNRFDLNSVPFRVTFCKIDEQKYQMVISNHHILYDGWSNRIILTEFFSFYNDLVQQKLPVKPNKQRYKEYTKRIQNQDRNKLEKFWAGYLKGFEDKSELSIKSKRRKDIIAAAAGNSHCSAKFSKKVREKLEIFTKRHKITLACLLYSAWGILLQRYNNSRDVIFGTTVSGRSSKVKGIEDIVGLFINTVPLRIRTSSNDSEMVKDFLYRIDEELRERQEYESASLVEIKQYAEPVFEDELFDTIFVIENYPLGEMLSRGTNPLSLLIDSYSVFETTHYDLTVGVTLIDDIEMEFTYNKEQFEEAVIKELPRHFVKIVETIIENPGKEIPELELLSEAEKSKILYDFNKTGADYPKDRTIHGLFSDQTGKIPDNIAVIGGESGERKRFTGSLTYKELNEKSGRLACLLRHAGLEPGDIAAIIVERSLDMLIGIMGILKAGGTYLPIAAGYPQERTSYMLADSNAKILVTTFDLPGEIICEKKAVHLPEAFNAFNCVPGSTPTRSNHNPHAQPAYIIYTSGTTGKPKGVIIEHSAVMNRLFWIRDKYRLQETDVIMQATSFVFDVSVCEMFRWIPAGGKLCLLPPGGEKDPGQIIRTIAKNGVTTADFIPALLTQLLDYADRQNLFKELTGLRWVWTGVEVVDPDLVKGFNETLHRLNRTRLINAYGPTESTVDVTYFDCSDIETYDCDVVPIGRPMANVRIYILANSGTLQPVGVYGQLCIAGKGLARGYLNNPELTAEKFDHDLWDYPDYQDEKLLRGGQGPPDRRRLYQTGDLARWLPDGNIQFLGRMDHQVKIRGHRIELGEIESRLLRNEKIKDVVVTVRGGNEKEKYLCAYITSEEKIDISGLEDELSSELPDYMVPSYIRQLDKIPLTASGKVDRRALPEPGPGLTAGEYTAPVDRWEEKLVSIWSDVLNLEKNEIGTGYNFFKLGGHSLKAVRLISAILKELKVEVPLEEIFKLPTIKGLAGYIRKLTKEKTGEQYIPAELVEKKKYYALASEQRRLYFLQEIDENSPAYNMTSVWLMEGAVDKMRLADTLAKLIQRHESLRTSFKMIDQEPVQVVHNEVEFEIEYYDMQVTGAGDRCRWKSEGTRGLAPLPPKSQELRAKSCISSFLRPFDLSRAPLLRVGWIKEKAGKHFLVLNMHHIISDGLSVEILLKEFAAFWAGKEFPQLKLRYRDYPEWQKQINQREKITPQEAFWLKQFEGEIPVLDLPMDYTRPAIQSFAGRHIHFEIHRKEADVLKSMARQQEVTLFMLLLSLYTVFLSKLTSQEDIVVGTPIANRRHPDLEPIIGMFVNTLVLRNFPIGQKRFLLFLEEVKETTIQAFENRDYLYEDLVEKVEIERDTGRNPLFDTMFVLQNMEVLELEIPGVNVQPVVFETQISKFDITLTAVEKKEKLAFTFEYCTKLFKEETIRRFAGFFKKTILTILENHDIRILEIEIISEEEKNRLLYEFNDTKADYPLNKTIHQLFQEQAEKQPHQVVLAAQSAGRGPQSEYEKRSPLRAVGDAITYRELNNQSDLLAHILIEKGVTADTTAAIMVERSIQMIIGILGILKAGGAYLPIDPGYPPERIDFMLKDSKAKILLKDNDFTPGVFNNRPKGTTSHLHLSPAPATSLAYIIYTSGSTGTPKGVMIGHRNVNNLVTGLKERIYSKYTRKLHVCLLSPYVFDASVKQVFGALLLGHGLYIVPEDLRMDGPGLLAFYKRYGIDISDGTPTHIRLLLESGAENTLSDLDIKQFIIGGEALSRELVKEFLNKAGKSREPGRKIPVITNVYGPTECSVDSASYDIPAAGIIPDDTIPIGTPMPNQRIYILNQNHRLQPVGITGELFIGGEGLARGYLNNPELTAQKFDHDLWDLQVPGPYALRPRLSLYKTGDLAKWLKDGNIEFLGRIGHQVKLRGFRIELKEIEQQLLTYGKIKDAIVIAREDNNDKYLCAYIIARANETIPIELSGIREYLSNRLPDYMVPAYFVQLDEIPLTPNGKLDRKALPVPKIKAGDKFEAPRDRIEKKLVEIWSGVLGIEKEKLGINDNFFHLGGHSLKAIRVTAALHKEFDVKLPPAVLFKNPTIKKISAVITGVEKTKFIDLEICEKKEFYELTYYQKRLWLLNRLQPGGTSFNMVGKLQLEHHVDENLITKAVYKLTRRHESLRTGFKIIDGEPVQYVAEAVEISLRKIDLSFFDQNQKQEEKEKVFTQEEKMPLDLNEIPLFRPVLVKLDDTYYELIFNIHHIITDGWSMEILKKEFFLYYEGFRNHREYKPGELKIQYKEFAAWHNKQSADTALKMQSHLFWKEKLQAGISTPGLPVNPKGDRNDPAGAGYQWLLHKNTKDKLNTLAQSNRTTLFVVLFSLYLILLYDLSKQEKIVCSIISAGRENLSVQNVVGFFVNSILFNIDFDTDERFVDFIHRVSNDVVNIFQHQWYPIELIFKELKMKYPDIPVSFNMLNLRDEPAGLSIDGIETGHIENIQDVKFDMEIYANQFNNGISIFWAYKKSLFDPVKIECFVEDYIALVDFFKDNFHKSYSQYKGRKKKKSFRRNN
jgi:amino acid adenylation domain-containing protein